MRDALFTWYKFNWSLYTLCNKQNGKETALVINVYGCESKTMGPFTAAYFYAAKIDILNGSPS